MAAGAWARTAILSKTYNFETDSFKMGLLTSASNLTVASTDWASVTGEHANQSAPGYETGGKAVALSLTGTTTVKCDIDTDPSWTATGGSITAKWAAIYLVGGNVVCFCLLDSGGADITATTGNTYTVAANASGVFTLA
jgi:hypothetical protein